MLLALWLLITAPSVNAQQGVDPSTLNGGSLLAMAGRDSVVLAVDRRFAREGSLVNVASRSVLIPSPTLMVACCGLEGDVYSLQQTLQAQVSQKYQRGLGLTGSSTFGLEESSISPSSMTSLTSHMLYRRKNAPFYVEPIIVGLEPESCGNRLRPYLCSLDMIGATSTSREFVCAGAASKSLYGAAEAAFQPDLDSERLLEICGRCFISALERDCLSGYGATLYLITREGIDEYELAGRND